MLNKTPRVQNWRGQSEAAVIRLHARLKAFISAKAKNQITNYR